jgi:predicted dehydrogenase
MAPVIRFGVIGTSWWADLTHLPMLKADPRVALNALCGRNRERADEMARKYGFERVNTDYRDMIDRGDLDAIVISAPDDQHYQMVMDALEAGLHVVCEKPLALNAADAKAMYEKAEQKGLRHMAFFTWRWMPQYRYARELVEDGAIGRLYHAAFRFSLGLGRNPQYGWRFDRARSNGVLGDFGSHMFDMARYLAGDITGVSALIAAHAPHNDADGRPMVAANDSSAALVQFSSGAHGMVDVSYLARLDKSYPEQQVVLHGEAGSLVIELSLSGGLRLRYAKGDDPLQDLAVPAAYLQGIDAAQPFLSSLVPMFAQQPIGCRLFVDEILKGRTVAPSFYDGWKAQQIVDAALASHQSGQWTTVGEG